MKINTVKQTDHNHHNQAFGMKFIQNKHLNTFRRLYFNNQKDWLSFCAQIAEIGSRKMPVELGIMYEVGSAHTTLKVQRMLQNPLFQHLYNDRKTVAKHFKFASPNKIIQGCQQLAKRLETSNLK